MLWDLSQRGNEAEELGREVIRATNDLDVVVF